MVVVVLVVAVVLVHAAHGEGQWRVLLVEHDGPRARELRLRDDRPGLQQIDWAHLDNSGLHAAVSAIVRVHSTTHLPSACI